MDFLTAISAFTATNNDPNFIFSLGPIERFLENMSGFPLFLLHWAIWALIWVTLVYNIYSMWLRALTRWSDYQAKIAVNKKTENDTHYGKDIDSAIKKAFDAIPDSRGGHNTANTISNSDKRLKLFIEIVKHAEKHLNLKDWRFVISSSSTDSMINKIPVHDFIDKLIDDLEKVEKIVQIKSEDD